MRHNIAILLLMACLLWCGLGVAQAAPDPQSEGQKSATTKKPVSARQLATKLLVQAEKLQKEGKQTDALFLMQRASDTDPQWIQPYIAQARCLEVLKNYANAALQWHQVIDREPDNLEYKRCLARDELAALNFKDAEVAWLSISTAVPRDPEAAYALADIYMQTKRLKEAYVFINDVLDIQPHDVRANIYRARLDIMSGKYADAIARLHKIQTSGISDDTLGQECAAVLQEAQEKQTHFYIQCAGGVVAFGVLLLAGWLFYRSMRAAAAPVAPVLNLDDPTEDSLCDFLLHYPMYKLNLPRGLAWLVSLDERHLELCTSELIGETSGVAQVLVNRRDLTEWVEARVLAERSCLPFIYEDELQNPKFSKVFGDLSKELEDINVVVGVPVVFKDKLLALILLSCSRTDNVDSVRDRLLRCDEDIRGSVEKAAEALASLRSRKVRVSDTRTGMWNRDYFETHMASVMRGCTAANISMGVFMARLDQAPAILRELKDDDEAEFLYKLARTMYVALSGEMNLTMCHLGDGTFTVIAPERDENECLKIAETIKSAFDKSHLVAENVRSTGCVAYAVFPQDGTDAKQLRSMLTWAFRKAVYNDGDCVARVEKAGESDASEPTEKTEELVVRRTKRRVGNTDGDSPAIYAPFVKARITTNADVEAANRGDLGQPKVQPAPVEEPVIRRRLPSAESEGREILMDEQYVLRKNAPEVKGAAFKATTAAQVRDIGPFNSSTSATSSANNEVSQSSGGSGVSSTDVGSGKVQPVASGKSPVAAVTDSASSSVSSGVPVAKNAGEGSDYKLELHFDDDGVEMETQCCSQEVFTEVMDYELEQLGQEYDSCALVYVRLHNLIDIKAAGRGNYMQLRRSLATLMRVLLRADLDVPGLVGEDFAVFMIKADMSLAKTLADRIQLTSRNLDAGGYSIVPSISVTCVAKGEHIRAHDLIERAGKLAEKAGVNVGE